MKKCISFLLAISILLNFCFAEKKSKKKDKKKNKVKVEKIVSTENEKSASEASVEPSLTSDVPSEDVEISISAKDLSQDPDVPLPKYTLRKPEGSPVKLRESWGYVMQNRLDEYTPGLPLTDICFFSADIDCYGKLVNIPSRSKIKTNGARCHLVITCDSKSLSHFILQPGSDVRKKLLKDIVKAGTNYDGVQIDFELIPLKDKTNFINFLADLRYMLGQKKWFTVCVPARNKFIESDVYSYKEISRFCDRVFIMAYDEHWSTSAPGAVASTDWCRKVAEYAKKTIPEKKLIIGVPLYGRTWASETTAGAWYFSGANRIMTEHGVENVIYEDDIPTFKYTANVEVTGYFNDIHSVLALCRIYEEFGIRKMGFWRVGFEDPELWNWIKISR